jgi:hypothetical protein
VQSALPCRFVECTATLVEIKRSKGVFFGRNSISRFYLTTSISKHFSIPAVSPNKPSIVLYCYICCCTRFSFSNMPFVLAPLFLSHMLPLIFCLQFMSFMILFSSFFDLLMQFLLSMSPNTFSHYLYLFFNLNTISILIRRRHDYSIQYSTPVVYSLTQKKA